MTRLRSVGAALASVAGVLVVACSSSSGGNAGGTGTATPVSQQDFPMQLTSAVCDNIAPCCMNAGFAFDANGCKTTELISVGELTKSASLDGVSWDANKAGACLALLKQATTACKATSDVLHQIDDTCSAILVGTKAPGTPCTNSSQCAAPAGSKASCPTPDFGGGVPATGGSGGAPPPPTCQVSTPMAHGKAGDPCNSTCTVASGSGSSGVCEGQATSGGAGGTSGSGPAATGTCYTSDGLACDFATSTCKPLVAVGQPCSDSLSCVDGATCGPAGVCAAKPQAGEACLGSGTCATGLYCDNASQKCAAQKALGDSCTSGFGECGPAGSCKSGKCVDGESIATPDICTGKSSTGPLPGMGGAAGGAPKG